MSPVRPERRLLGQQVVDAVVALIADRGLEPGSRLPSETRLAAEFGVSRPIVREALRALSERGVLDVVNGKGAVLRALDSRPLSAFFGRAIAERADAVSELMEVRRGIEVQAAQLAARRAAPEQLAGLRTTALAMREALPDAEAYVALDTEFHMRLAEATGNVLIVHLMRSIRDMLEASIDEGFRSRRDADHIERAHARHETLVDELERGDAAAAASTMAAHFDDAVASLRRSASG